MNQEEFAQALQKYADVVVRVGLNLREGQRLFIFAETGAAQNSSLHVGDGGRALQ